MPWLPAALSVGVPLLSHLFGGDKSTQTPSTPKDLQPMRQQQIGLLQYLMGMGPDPRLGPAGPSISLPPGMTEAAYRSLESHSQNKGVLGSLSKNILSQVQAQGFGKPITPTAPQALPNQSIYHPQQPPMQPMGPMGGGIGGTTGLQLAGGGMVSGSGTGTSDSIPAQLSNGEGVLTAQTVQALGGSPIIDLLNHLGRQHFALGGVAGDPLMGGVAQTDLSAPSSGVQMWSGQQPVTLGPQPGTNPTIDVSSMNGGAGGAQTPQQRLESFYGPLGITPSTLQNQGTNAYSQMLNQPSPADRAANITLPQLQQGLTGNTSTQGAINGLMGMQTGAGADVTGRLGQIGQGGASPTGSSVMDQILQQLAQGTASGQRNLQSMGQGVNFSGSVDPTAQAALQGLAQNNPGMGVLQALNPAFQRNLAQADQVGGRFGTANALGRQTATDNYNQLAQQALQQGASQQMQAASSLGQLGNEANNQTLQGLLGGGNLALNANSQLANQQLGATGQAINANQGLNQNILQALSQLGGFTLAGQAQQGQNLGNAGQLGLGQGALQNNTAGMIGNILGQQGQQNLNTVNSAYGAGVNNTVQQNQGQQNAIGLLNQLLQTAQSASMGGPVQSTPGLGTQESSVLAGLMPFLSSLNQPQNQNLLQGNLGNWQGAKQ